jgi:hypothetical protein
LEFFLRSLQAQSFNELGALPSCFCCCLHDARIFSGDSTITKMMDGSQRTHAVDRVGVSERVKLLSRLLAAVRKLGKARLEHHKKTKKPRCVRLAEK